MLSGDHEAAALEVASAVGIAREDVYAGVKPAGERGQGGEGWAKGGGCLQAGRWEGRGKASKLEEGRTSRDRAPSVSFFLLAASQPHLTSSAPPTPSLQARRNW